MPSVKDIMTKTVASVNVNQTIFEAAELMSSKGISCVLVTDGEVPVGVVTERDIVGRVVAKRKSLDLKVSAIMSSSLITLI